MLMSFSRSFYEVMLSLILCSGDIEARFIAVL